MRTSRVQAGRGCGRVSRAIIRFVHSASVHGVCWSRTSSETCTEAPFSKAWAPDGLPDTHRRKICFGVHVTGGWLTIAGGTGAAIWKGEHHSAGREIQGRSGESGVAGEQHDGVSRLSDQSGEVDRLQPRK